MLKFICYSLAFLLFPFSAVFSSGNVLYGERGLETSALTVYFDKEGFIYPPCFISDSSLKRCDASLRKWYHQHSVEFVKIAGRFNISVNAVSDEGINALNDSLAFAFSRACNQSSDRFNEVSVLIHGYRKPFSSRNGDSSSGAMYHMMREKLLASGLVDNMVEVYWDGMYDCCFSGNQKKNRELYHLLMDADLHAGNAGVRLRSILNRFNFKTINIFSHSLGAKVALSALFNLVPTKEPVPVKPGVNICLIAPAVSGIEVFKNYYNRNYVMESGARDNYKLAILYNEHDFALRKKETVTGIFGPGPYKYINTTLGCNYHQEAIKTEKHFRRFFSGSDIRLFDVSFIGKCHHASCYMLEANLVPVLSYFKG